MLHSLALSMALSNILDIIAVKSISLIKSRLTSPMTDLTFISSFSAFSILSFSS